MLSTNHVTVRPTHQALDRGLDTMAGLEAGEFDFLDYLLGLQTSVPVTLGQSDEPQGGLETAVPVTDKGSIALLDLFQKKGGPVLWNMSVTSALPVEKPTITTSGEDVNQVEIAALACNGKPTHIVSEGAIMQGTGKPAASQEVTGDSLGSLSGVVHEQSLISQEGVQSLKRDLAIQKYGEMVPTTVNPETKEVTGSRLESTFTDKPVSSDAKTEQMVDVDNQRISATLSHGIDAGSLTPKRRHMQDDLNLEGAFDVGGKTTPTSTLTTADIDTSSGRDPVAVDELLDRVDSMALRGGGKMTVRLFPPELGSVEVQVVARGKNVEIEILSESSLVKSVLESRIDELKSSIQSHDLVLSKMEVHVNHETTLTSSEWNQFHSSTGQERQQFQSSFSHGGHGNNFEERGDKLHETKRSEPLLSRLSTKGKAMGRQLDLRI